MSDLVEFIRARLDEDERLARAMTPAEWEVRDGALTDGYELLSAWDADKLGGQRLLHIARHDPARVLREVEAKRAMLAYLIALEDKALDGNWWSLDYELPLKLLALPYADHPDYRAERSPSS